MSYHINAKGQPSFCHLDGEDCPEGSVSRHYVTAIDALEAHDRKTPEVMPRKTGSKAPMDVFDFDPATQSAFYNLGSRKHSSFAARDIKREIGRGDRLLEKSSTRSDPNDIAELHGKKHESDARVAAMLKEILFLSENNANYLDNLPDVIKVLLDQLNLEEYMDVPIGKILQNR